MPQAEKAAKVINEKADQVAENIEPMADKASKTLVENAEQISREGPEAADKAQAKVLRQLIPSTIRHVTCGLYFYEWTCFHCDHHL